MTVKAMAATAVPTPNYGKESPTAQGARLTPVLVAPLGGHNPVLTNDVIAGTEFGATGQANDANGVATVANLAWNEVGIITLAVTADNAGANDYLGAGAVLGTTTGTIGNVGRFYVAQLALSGGAVANRTGLGGVCAAPSGCGTFTYMGEAMSALFTLTAKAVNGTSTLQNYAATNNFAKLDPTAIGNPLVLGAVDSGTPRTVVSLDTSTYGTASGSFVSGVAAITAPFAVTRGVTLSGPFEALDVGVAPVDSDGAALATLNLAVNGAGTPNTHGKLASTKARYGRMKLSNAHGSELLRLPVAVTVQYWDGTSYVTSATDSATIFANANVVFSN